MLLALVTEPETNLMCGGNFEINHQCIVFEIFIPLVRFFLRVVNMFNMFLMVIIISAIIVLTLKN